MARCKLIPLAMLLVLHAAFGDVASNIFLNGAYKNSIDSHPVSSEYQSSISKNIFLEHAIFSRQAQPFSAPKYLPPKEYIKCGGGQQCVKKNVCQGGYFTNNPNGYIQNCEPETDVCCTYRAPPTTTTTTQRPSVPCSGDSDCVAPSQCTRGTINVSNYAKTSSANRCYAPEVCCRLPATALTPDGYVLTVPDVPFPQPQPSIQRPQTYQPPKQPTYQPPAPKPTSYIPPAPPAKPSYQPPVQPSYQPPVQPSYQPPARPTYQPPKQPSYIPPAPPATPSYQPPVRPSYQPPAPKPPTYSPPAPPATLPSYQPPARPSYQPPSQAPTYIPPAPPATPSYQPPARPSYQPPAAPTYQPPRPQRPQYLPPSPPAAPAYKPPTYNPAPSSLSPAYQPPTPQAPQTPRPQQPRPQPPSVQPPRPQPQRPQPSPPTGYLPPRQPTQQPNQPNLVGSPSNEVPLRGEDILSEPIYPSRKPPVFGDNLSPFAPQKCAAALVCTDVNYCDSQGTITSSPSNLSPQQSAFRAPLSDCTIEGTGAPGKCCRDSNYVDPWPVNPTGQCATRNKNTKPRGVTDEDTSFAEIPWQAMVLKESTKSLLCGGAIIGYGMVLTTASCLAGEPTKDILVKAGEWQLGSDDEPLPFQLVRASEVEFHPEYDAASGANNLAVILLEKNLQTAIHINPICISDKDPSASERCIVTGWGKDALRIHQQGALMHQTPADAVSRSECGASSTQVCARTKYDACGVDYGSALACGTGDSYTLKGIFTSEDQCGSSVATFTKPDIKWINTAFNSNNRALTLG
ncbi:inactive serine protease scarface [Eupeodes corollae]|uniref:inactive serine protease scarface n=1 Tax=Eupeodes corollae TaxID=290404 RepID=UPI0024937E1C|nr:inactive serine protease scarface [Eupeodes corollae]